MKRAAAAVAALFFFVLVAVQAAQMRADPHDTAARLYAAGGAPRLAALLATDTWPSAPRAVAPPRWNAEPSPHPSIVLVALRSARADRIPSSVTPYLTALAERGARFDRAYVTVADARASWRAFTSGRFHEEVSTTVPMRLAQAGYDVRALTDGTPSVLDGLGFGDVRGHEARHPERLAAEVATAIRTARRPFFVAASFDAIAPRHAVAGSWAARFGTPGYRGRFKYAGPPAGERAVLAEDVAQTKALYDAAFAAVDDALPAIVEAAAEANAVVVVTAEHGQALFEVGRGEGTGLDGDAAHHVPLVVVGPGVEPGRREAMVRDVDLAATIAELGGVRVERVDGVSLLDALRGRPAEDRLAYAETPAAPDLRTWSVRDRRWKLVSTPTRRGRALRLHDTLFDPLETIDVHAARPEVVARLAAKLERRRERATAPRTDLVWILTTGPVESGPLSFDDVWPDAEPREDAVRALLAGARPSFLGGEDAPSFEGVAVDAGMTSERFARIEDALAFLAEPHRDPRVAFVRTTERVEALPAREELVAVAVHVPDRLRASRVVLAAPGLGAEHVGRRAAFSDVAPTLVALLGLPRDPRMTGRSLLGLRGAGEPDARPIVVEGGAARSIVWGDRRLRRSGRTTQVFDLAGGPVRESPERIHELLARLDAAERAVPVAGTEAARQPGPVRARMQLRFAGGGAARRVSGSLHVWNRWDERVSPRVELVGLAPGAVASRASSVELSFTTVPDAVVGIDVLLGEPDVDVAWSLHLDDAPWPEDAVFAGSAGLPAPTLRTGALGRRARVTAIGAALPTVDPAHDVGLFVVRTDVAAAPL